ncbi:MAG TPA: cytochrome b/b6 domain-containing protein, partial [Steroidobacteraceae bacterium]|nr:cytochrome b/b6 domain-containing protein [Steroidobacteraceae bacterium]
QPADAIADPRTRLVWDLPARVMHWGIVLAGVGSYVTQKVADDAFRLHLWCGYTMLVLVATRIAWGFVGPRHARFASFVRGPRAVLRYAASLVRRPHEIHAGHNPLGGWMVLLLLAMLMAQAVSGLFANDEVLETGPLFGYVTVSTSDALTDLHETLFDWLLVAAGAHIVAVLLYLLVRRENLIVPMLTGRKPAAWVRDEEAIDSSRAWLAALIATSVAGALALAVRSAPEASLSFF